MIIHCRCAVLFFCFYFERTFWFIAFRRLISFHSMEIKHRLYLITACCYRSIHAIWVFLLVLHVLGSCIIDYKTVCIAVWGDIFLFFHSSIHQVTTVMELCVCACNYMHCISFENSLDMLHFLNHITFLSFSFHLTTDIHTVSLDRLPWILPFVSYT